MVNKAEVCDGPAVMVKPELEAEAVVSITNMSSLVPPVSVITNALVLLFDILTNESN